MKKTLISSISDENFDEYTFENDRPVIAFFGSKKCNICKELYPVIQEIAAEYIDEIRVYWVDVDSYKPVFQRFRLRGIPNLVLFNHGQVIDKISGFHPKEVLLQVLEKVLHAESIVPSMEEEVDSHMECLGCN